MQIIQASIMKKIGYHDFVTDSAADYVNIADKLYDRLTLSEELKINLRKEAKNRLFDAKSYTQELEQNYQKSRGSKEFLKGVLDILKQEGYSLSGWKGAVS